MRNKNDRGIDGGNDRNIYNRIDMGIKNINTHNPAAIIMHGLVNYLQIPRAFEPGSPLP